MTAVTFRQPAGIPGAMSRMEHSTIEPQYIDATQAAITPLIYGSVVKTVAGLMQIIQSGDAATVITGFLMRPYPGGGSTDPLGTYTAPTSGMCNRMKRGYMTVKTEGTGAKDAPVYVRVTANTSPTRPVGNISDAADSGKCVIIPGAFFVGPADAAGNTEIAYNI